MSDDTGLTLAQIDRYLKIFCVLILAPLFPALFFKPTASDLLTYFSFVLAAWGAAYTGRGVFPARGPEAGKGAVKNWNPDDPRTSVCIGLGFIGTAAVVIAPLMYRGAVEPERWGIVVPLVFSSLAFVGISALEFTRDNRYGYGRAMLWFLLPATAIVLIARLFAR